MFWSLSLYDLYVPTGRYDEEIAKANQANQALESDMELVGVGVCVCVCVFLMCVFVCACTRMCACVYIFWTVFSV